MKRVLLAASAAAIAWILAGCATRSVTVASVDLPMRVAALDVVFVPPCGEGRSATPCVVGHTYAHVEREVRSAIESELVPALAHAGIAGAVFEGASSRPASELVLRVRLMAVHEHYAFYNGTATTRPTVDIGITLQSRATGQALWRTEIDEPWPGFYIDVQPRFDALLRRVASAALEAVAPPTAAGGAAH